MTPRWLFLLLAMAALGAAGGCATPNEHDVSAIPWNRPQPWEGTGALGGMPMPGNANY